MKPRLLIFGLVPFLLAIQGCTPSADLATTSAIDPMGRLNREDYLALRDRNENYGAEDVDRLLAAIPPIPAMPQEETIAPNSPLNKLVSVMVTDSVPVREVLLELVRKTGANLELDPRVQGNVIIAAHNQPFRTVLKRICDMAKLRYSVDGDFLHIEPDEPYQKTYRLDYLSLTRKTSSNTSISTNVFDVDVGTNASTSSTHGSTSAENNSSAKVTSVSEADFWTETEKSVEQILGVSNRNLVDAKKNYSVNKQAGIVTIFGDQKQQDSIAQYFAELRTKASAQVLIDARIVEVQLDESYASGIDWSTIFNGVPGIAATFGTQATVGTSGFFTAGLTSKGFDGLINLVQTFGTTRVLSAPRVTVLNNQTAVMKVATNQVYFVTQAQFTTTASASGAVVTSNPVYTSTPRTVPVGLVMTVQPSIDMETGRITMTLRPTISRVVGQVSDPSIGLNSAVAGVTSSVESNIPILAVREMDSVIQLNSGEIAVMGGLMQDSSINQDQGIPGLSDMAYVGNLFKSRDNQGKISELVILLRATISNQPRPDKTDNNLYHLYGKDPRPLTSPPKASLLLDEDELDDDEDLSDSTDIH